MSARVAAAVFLGWLVGAFVVVSVVTIYGFDYFEGALGGRTDNLLLSMVVNIGLAVVITAGLAAVLIWRASDRKSFRGSHLLIAAAIACGLAYAVALTGPLLDHVGSWQLRLAILTVYSIVVGAVIGGGLLRFAKDREHAA